MCGAASHCWRQFESRRDEEILSNPFLERKQCQGKKTVLSGANSMLQCIEAEAAKTEYGIILCELPAQQRAYTGFQLSEIKGLYKIVVGPMSKPSIRCS